jgi:type I restriction enzyme S subunit
MIIGRGLHAIRSHVENQLFIYHQLKEIFFRPDMIGGGTIFNSVTKSDMLNIELIRPKAHIEGQFEEIATSISSYIDLLTRKNALLTKTRDLLLPRLISGQLDLSGLEVLYAEYSQ